MASANLFAPTVSGSSITDLFLPSACAQFYLNADQTVAGVAVDTPLVFDTVVYAKGWEKDGTNPSQLVCPVSGLYEVVYSLFVSSVTGGTFRCWLSVNGTAVPSTGIRETLPAAEDTRVTGNAIVSMNKDDYLEFVLRGVADLTADFSAGGGTIPDQPAAMLTIKQIG